MWTVPQPPRGLENALAWFRAWALTALVVLIIGIAKIIAHSPNGGGTIAFAVIIFLVAADRFNRRLHPERYHTRPRPYARQPIPQAVKDAVWRRDEGRCRNCGSQSFLEFDHIVPHSKGGPTTYRNLQLLCQDCNRRKGARV